MVTLFFCCSASLASAQTGLPDLPPLPPLPGAGQVPTDPPPAPEPVANDAPAPPSAPPDIPAPDFNMSNPFGIPQPPAPLEPTLPQVDDGPAEDAPMADLPLPNDEELFEFFQPGYQPPAPEPEPTVTEAPAEAPAAEEKPEPKKVVRRAPARAVYGRNVYRGYNFKRQTLPQTIYRHQYSSQNRHLPLRQTLQSRDVAAFHAAAKDDLNGVRAVLQGGRPIGIRNQMGETLLDVATRYRAHRVARYLINIGVPFSHGYQTAYSRGDARSVHAYRTIGY